MTTSRKSRGAADASLGRILLRWYDRHARVLPWRSPAGIRPDPYRVWLSEVMLQQTTVATVGPYFARFLARWPDIRALAAAPREDILSAWAGLGYYARARNLHACAEAVHRDHGGVFPDTEAGLRALPGIGAYTAGAIAAIAFDRPALAIDGNAERVVTRIAAIATPLPAAKAEIRAVLARLLPADRPGDFAQALMDLGATLCTPRAPRCDACPWREFCKAHASGSMDRFPVKAAKRDRPLRLGIAYVLRNAAGDIWLTQRADDGLLGGMRAVPTTPWSVDGPDAAAERKAKPGGRGWRFCPEAVRHGFTHFELALRVAVAIGHPRQPATGRWWAVRDLHDAGLPTVFRKVVKAALASSNSATFIRP